MTISVLTPKEIVRELDKHIIGQDNAKRSVAIALRNRYRRMRCDENLRNEITPKNILMIGPTGVGKTEIARRLARLSGAPFIKVEATKFTEVGYVGRDVDSIIRDLTDISFKLTREKAVEEIKPKAESASIERILDVLVPKPKIGFMDDIDNNKTESIARTTFRDKLLSGELDEQDIEIEIQSSSVGVEIMAPPGMEEMSSQLQGMFQSLSSNKKKARKLRIKDALKIINEEEAARLIDSEDIKTKSIEAVEQNGIVFLDEIDKITQRSERNG